MAECPAVLLRYAALLLGGTVYLPSEPGSAPGAPTFRLVDAPEGTIEFGHAQTFPVAALVDDQVRALMSEQAGDGDELAFAAALAEDVAHQWRRSREQGLPYETRSQQLMERAHDELSACDAARLVPDQLLLWFRRAYALVPQAEGRITAHGQSYEPIAPIPVDRWWCVVQERAAAAVREHLRPHAAAFALDPRPLERFRTLLAEAAEREVTVFDDPPLRITWDTHESVMSFAMSFPGFAQQDAWKRWYAFPPGTFSLYAGPRTLRDFVLSPGATRLHTRVAMPSASDIIHPFVSEMGRELCSAGHVEMIFCDEDLSPAAMIIKALERGVQVLLGGQGSRTRANPYRKLAESHAPRTTRWAAKRQGLMIIPWVNSERGRKTVKL